MLEQLQLIGSDISSIFHEFFLAECNLENHDEDGYDSDRRSQCSISLQEDFQKAFEGSYGRSNHYVMTGGE